jgi:hypothetical protein
MDMAALAQALAPVLTPEITKAVREQLGGEVAQQSRAKSDSDRRMKYLDAFTGVDPQTLKTFASYLKDNGNDVDKALRDTRRDMALDAISRGEFPVSTEGAVLGRTDGAQAVPKSEDQKASDISMEILSEAEIEPDDEGYRDFVTQSRKSGQIKTAEQWEKALRSWAIKTVRQRAIPAAVVAGEGRSRPPASPKETALRAEYEKRKDALRPGSIDELYNLKSEFKKKGLDDLF